MPILDMSTGPKFLMCNLYQTSGGSSYLLALVFTRSRQARTSENCHQQNPTTPPVSRDTSDLIARRRGALKTWGHCSTEYHQLNRAVRSAIWRDTRVCHVIRLPRDVCRRIREQGLLSVWRNTRDDIGEKSSGRRTLPSVSANCMNEFFVQVGPRDACGQRGGRPRSSAMRIDCQLPRV